MFDGLIEVLMSWLAQAWCWLLDVLIKLALFIMQFISSILPHWGVPDSLVSWQWHPVTLGILVHFFPFDTFFLALSIVMAFELVVAVGIPIVRSIMDLL
ncbi:MAG: hypothetical protein D3920_00890 [Candidatus Electrothrix sp. AW2]|nr:hypothetical protein [Candidatus Electrothrix gigas]